MIGDPWLPIVAPIDVILRNLMIQPYFEVFYSLLVEKTLEYWRFIIGDPWLPIVAPSNQ